MVRVELVVGAIGTMSVDGAIAPPPGLVAGVHRFGARAISAVTSSHLLTFAMIDLPCRQPPAFLALALTCFVGCFNFVCLVCVCGCVFG